jgi:hypothetical protein
MKYMPMIKISALILGFFAIPVFVMASSVPSIELVGVNSIERNSASAVVVFENNNPSYNFLQSNPPTVLAEFTNTKTGYSYATAYAQPSSTSHTYYFRIDSLEPDTEYHVVGVMRYEGKTYISNPRVFKTKGSPTASTTTGGSQNNPSSGTTGSDSAVITLPTVGSLFGSGSASVKNSVQNKVMTGGVTNKDGIGIAITNEQARVDARDTFTYTVRYQNGRTTSLQNTKIVIELPDQYEFVRSTAELDYKTQDNTVHMTIGRIAPGTTKSFTFTARALDGNNGEVATKASLFYEGGSISTVDRDAFYGGAKSALGASVFGLGFFPQTLFGWVALIILITIVVIVARRYTTASVVPPVPPLQPGQDPNQKTA